MRRGEIWTVAGGADYAGKPRPAVIIQDDRFCEINSVTIVGFTTNVTDAPFFRVSVPPSRANGLDAPSRLMVDKIATVARSKLVNRIGRLGEADVTRLNSAVLVFLGMAG